MTQALREWCAMVTQQKDYRKKIQMARRWRYERITQQVWKVWKGKHERLKMKRKKYKKALMFWRRNRLQEHWNLFVKRVQYIRAFNKRRLESHVAFRQSVLARGLSQWVTKAMIVRDQKRDWLLMEEMKAMKERKQCLEKFFSKWLLEGKNQRKRTALEWPKYEERDDKENNMYRQSGRVVKAFVPSSEKRGNHSTTVTIKPAMVVSEPLAPLLSPNPISRPSQSSCRKTNLSCRNNCSTQRNEKSSSRSREPQDTPSPVHRSRAPNFSSDHYSSMGRKNDFTFLSSSQTQEKMYENPSPSRQSGQTSLPQYPTPQRTRPAPRPLPF